MTPVPVGDAPNASPLVPANVRKMLGGEYGYNAWKEQYEAQKKHFEDNKFRFSVPMTDSRDKAYFKHRYNKSFGGDQ